MDVINPTSSLSDNNRLTIVNDSENGVVKSYKISPTNHQFLKFSLKYFAGRLCIDIRKWKHDIWHGTDDYFPSNQGITVDISSFNDILDCMHDIQSNHLIDKSIR